MKIRANLICGQINQFQKFTGISDAAFGRYALNDSNFVARLYTRRDGGMVTIATAHKCGEYMLRVLESCNVPESVKFRKTLAEWLARNPVETATPTVSNAPTVITQAIPAAIADKLKPGEAFILQKYIDAAVNHQLCPTYAQLAAAYKGGKSLAWPNPNIMRLKHLGLIRMECGQSSQRRVMLLFAPFDGMSTEYTSHVTSRPKQVKEPEPVAPIQRVEQSEPCFKCGCARGCDCGAPALIHTRISGHLPNLLRSAAR